MRAVAKLLSDGQRLHMQHGPIDIVLSVDPKDPAARTACFKAAFARFETILAELVEELPILRAPVCPHIKVAGAVALRMINAVHLEKKRFLTPMAAVAGAVADEVLDHILAKTAVNKALVNNGGDIAYFLGPKVSSKIMVSSPEGVQLGVVDLPKGLGGVATSGWRGRSHSLGIADSVTVMSRSAAMADACATLVCNAVDLPSHPAIKRQPAQAVDPESDLGLQPVVVGCGALNVQEAGDALAAGICEASRLKSEYRLSGAALFLADQQRMLSTEFTSITQPPKVAHHA